MATHVLWQADVADFDAWYGVFKQDRLNRRAVGIKALHVWKDPARENRAVAFFDSEELAMHMERDGVAHVETRLLQPA